MAVSSASSPFAEDAQIWQSLKSAIATSSGFKRWQSEQPQSQISQASQDMLVRLYLRETLETLAY